MPDADLFSFSLLLLACAAFFAGFVDAVVGGGGLIQIPALFSAFPRVEHTVLLATNKLISFVGTSSAAVRYTRRVRLPRALLACGMAAALGGSYLGAWTVRHVPADFMRPLVLVLLVGVAGYSFLKKDFGTDGSDFNPAPTRGNLAAMACIGLSVGWYDGFFGPGTGSFFIFLLVRFVRMDFLHASAAAKVLNVATNVSALAYFVSTVELLWKVAAVMAVCNLAGALTGSGMALRHGVRFVRKLFLLVVIVLIAKMSYDLVRDNAQPAKAVSRETSAALSPIGFT